MNQTDRAVSMLKKCLHLNPNYISAYLLLAKLYNGQIAGKLLKHVTRLQPTDSNYYMYYAQWLHKKRKCSKFCNGVGVVFDIAVSRLRL